ALRQRCQTPSQLSGTQPGSRLPSSTPHMVLSLRQQVLSTHREGRTPAPPTGSLRLSPPAVSHPHRETPSSISEGLGRLPKTSQWVTLESHIRVGRFSPDFDCSGRHVLHLRPV